MWKVLRRAGISRPLRAAREPANRYEWPCPGDLLHMDVSRYARFRRPKVQADERAATVVGFLERALDFFASQGIIVRRVMTDNA